MSKFTLTEGIKRDDKNVSSGRERKKIYIYIYKIDKFRDTFSEFGTYDSNLYYFQGHLWTVKTVANRNYRYNRE